MGTSVYSGQNLPPLVGIGFRWLPKLGVDTSPRPHAHRRACYILTASLIAASTVDFWLVAIYHKNQYVILI